MRRMHLEHSPLSRLHRGLGGGRSQTGDEVSTRPRKNEVEKEVEEAQEKKAAKGQ